MDDTEVVVNLWYVVDEATRLIYRLAGRAYVLSGSEERKLGILKALSTTDYLAATSFRVPERFSVSDGPRTLSGYCSVSMVDAYPFELFAEVLEHIESTMPTQASFEGENAEAFKIGLPEDPLCVTTALIEGTDGVVRPQV